MDKLILIDDDAILRRAISQSIDWEKHGIELCGAARDAIEGMELIARCEPDVVVTDIRMPQISGIELCAILNREYPDIKTVLLSGHEEFEYAQKAIESRVFAYLTKPVKNDALVEVVKRAISEKRSETERRQLLDAGMPLVRSHIFREAFNSSLSPEKLHSFLQLLGIRSWQSCAVAVFQLYSEEVAGETLDAITSGAVEAVSNEPALIKNVQFADLGGRKFAAVSFAVQPEDDSQTQLQTLAQKLRAYFEQLHGLRLRGVISRNQNAGPLALHSAYAEAAHSAAWDQSETLERVVFAVDYPVSAIQARPEQARRTRSQMLADKAVAYLHQHYADPELSLAKLANEMDVSYTYLSQIFTTEVGQNFQPCLQAIRMEKARELLAREDLKGYEIAEKVGFSNAYYFGACFKKYTGMTISEYKKKLHP